MEKEIDNRSGEEKPPLLPRRLQGDLRREGVKEDNVYEKQTKSYE